jgi:hypothetical protein
VVAPVAASGSALSVPVSAPPPGTTAPPAPRTVIVRFETTPPGASVTVADVDVGRTPVDATVPAGALPVPYRMSLPGFDAATGTLLPDADRRIARSFNRPRGAASSSAPLASAPSTPVTAPPPAPSIKPWM